MATPKSETTKQLELPETDNFSIRAGAGCGKTTTLEWCEEGVPDHITPTPQQEKIFEELEWDHTSPKGSTRFCCFNTSIKKEAEPRFPETQVTTNHSLGYQTVLNYLNVKPNRYYMREKKYGKLLQEMIGNPFKDSKLWPVYSATLKLCDLARQTLCGESLVGSAITGTSAHTQAMWEIDPVELRKMGNFYGVDIDKKSEAAYDLVEDLINAGIRSVRECQDYTDMIFLPNVFGCKPKRVYRCYVDEAQDLNAAQRGLLLGSAEQFVVVGDVFQSIYGFAGADPESIPMFEAALEAEQLPLTVTRRCPKRHVQVAKEYLPSSFPFAAADDAPDGRVVKRFFGESFYQELVGTDNLILSRTNAPLVEHCFRCWKAGIPALIRGRDIAKNLVSVIRRIDASDNKTLIKELHNLYETKIAKLKADEKEEQASRQEDELTILVMFATETETPKECISKLYDMFDDKNIGDKAVQFSTVHKAKGLEAENLGIITPSLLPHPYISKLGPFWAQQERNIAYVCYTRGKQNMFINDGE